MQRMSTRTTCNVLGFNEVNINRHQMRVSLFLLFWLRVISRHAMLEWTL
jgi:hypothetical protein